MSLQVIVKVIQSVLCKGTSLQAAVPLHFQLVYLAAAINDSEIGIQSTLLSVFSWLFSMDVSHPLASIILQKYIYHFIILCESLFSCLGRDKGEGGDVCPFSPKKHCGANGNFL